MEISPSSVQKLTTTFEIPSALKVGESFLFGYSVVQVPEATLSRTILEEALKVLEQQFRSWLPSWAFPVKIEGISQQLSVLQDHMKEYYATATIQRDVASLLADELEHITSDPEILKEVEEHVQTTKQVLQEVGKHKEVLNYQKEESTARNIIEKASEAVSRAKDAVGGLLEMIEDSTGGPFLDLHVLKEKLDSSKFLSQEEGLDASTFFDPFPEEQKSINNSSHELAPSEELEKLKALNEQIAKMGPTRPRRWTI